jgi:hypothetical protein
LRKDTKTCENHKGKTQFSLVLGAKKWSCQGCLAWADMEWIQLPAAVPENAACGIA